MDNKQIIIAIQYHALKVYFDAGTKRLKRIKSPARLKEIKLALAQLSAEMDALAIAYQAESGTVAPMEGIIPPPPPPPPPEDWP